jgi:predicted metal-dependent phosphoesterase TrpH
MRVDLHMHTTASDGQYAPAELVSLAARRGLDVIAITDHDTTDGVAEAQRAAATGLPLVIPGIELSAEDMVDDRLSDVHILGYYIDTQNPDFQRQLQQFRTDRFTRGERIVQRLSELGMPLRWARVLEIAESGAIGRPHIAKAMVEAGYVNSVSEAFERFIYNGGPAYVARKRMSPEEAIALIHSAGGVAVMAHPGLVRNYESLLRERLIPAGLDGVEVVHPKNPEVVRLNLRGLAQHYNLIMTGGSDFHAPEEDGSLLLGTLTPPEGCVAALKARARK